MPMGDRGRGGCFLPPEFSALSGTVEYIRKVNTNEYSSSCPYCGGDPHRNGDWPDRFRIFTNGKPRGWCRKCGKMWFPDMGNKDYKPDYQLIEQWQRERHEAALQEKQRAQRILSLLAQEKRWLEYHKNLEDQKEYRQWWRSSGIPDAWQDYWCLGYVPEKTIRYNGNLLTTSAYTIPKFDFGERGVVVTNIDFRLINPPDGVGKYRPLAELPASAFISKPTDGKFTGQVIVVEGSKKAMVLAICTGSHLVQVVGLPGCGSWANMDERLRDSSEVDRVWVVFDPDATMWGHKFAQNIGAEKARVVELPVKPDDAFTMYGMSKQGWERALRQAIKPNT